jgi:hypothetical protein
MKKIHLSLGIGGIIIFLLTGQYMNIHIVDIANVPDIERMAWRANHLYIFYISLLHLMLGFYMQPMSVNGAKNTQHLGSILFIVAMLLLLGAFFIEPPSAAFARPLSFFGAISALFAAGFNTIAMVLERRKSKAKT